MKINHIEIKTEEDAKLYFEMLRWGSEGKKSCGTCGAELREASHSDMDYWCRTCRKYSSIRTHTILEKSRFTFLTLIQGIILVTMVDTEQSLVTHIVNYKRYSGISWVGFGAMCEKFHEVGALDPGLTIEERLKKLLEPRS